MKSLLIALGLALCCVVQAQKKIDLAELEGDYYVRVMVTNCQRMKERLPHMPASPVSFEKKSADEVQMTMEMATPHGCKTIRPVLKRENGKFITHAEECGKKTVEDLNISGDTMISEITLSHPKGQCKMVTFATRDLSDIQKHMKEIRSFADSHGLKGEKIHNLTLQGICERGQ